MLSGMYLSLIQIHFYFFGGKPFQDSLRTKRSIHSTGLGEHGVTVDLFDGLWHALREFGKKDLLDRGLGVVKLISLRMAGLMEASSSSGLPEISAISMVEAAIDELYNIRDTFFPKDPKEKTARLQKHADAALVLVDTAIPQELRKSSSQRALYEFLRGKILDVFPDYQKEAEDHLSKAVKLNPSLADAWSCLGNCIWKKGDLPSSKNCFSLALSKGPNKKILCQLSMLERSMAQALENQAHLLDESIQHAKAAVMLDIKDGSSWYNLGNAYLTSFFVTGAWDHSKLQQSLKAYQNAEKDEQMKLNPDLYFNCATANKYLENYERALHGFEAAASRDPGLNADKEVNKIIVLLDKLENSLKGQARSKRLASLVESLGEVNLISTHKKANINILTQGLNNSVMIVGKVLLFVKHDDIAPSYYVVGDSSQSCFILSVYGVHQDAIKEGDRVTLLDPFYRISDLTWKEKHYQFKSIRVDFVEQILVNETALTPRHAVRASIQAQLKS